MHCIPKLALFALLSLPTLAAVPDGPSSSPCMQLEPVASFSEVFQVLDCTCAGGTVVAGGWVQTPWVGGQGSYESPKGLLCESVLVHAAYDKPVPGGTTTVEWDKNIPDQIFMADCDTSGCGRFLGFLWSVGGGKCTLADPVQSGAHGHYKLTGLGCTGDVDPRPSVLGAPAVGGA